MAQQLINIVVTCTNKKKHVPDKRHTFRNIRARMIEDRFRKWEKELSSSKKQPVSAQDVYCGDHWSVVQTLGDTASESDLCANVWVCSAGYGLIRLQTPIHSYAATFSAKNEDSVIKKSDPMTQSRDRRRWWELMGEWEGPEPGQPRKLTELAKQNPDAPIFVAASEDYLRAMRDDLLAVSRLSDKAGLLIISAKLKSFGELTDNLLPCDARLQRKVSGSLHSLNVRILRKVLEDAPGEIRNHQVLRRRYKKLVAKAGSLPVYNRKQLSDTKVKAFIEEKLKKNREFTHTALLRQLRDSDYACEQKRFANLYRQVSECHIG